MSSAVTSSSAYVVGRSLAVIALIEYLQPTIANGLAAITPSYAGLLSKAAVVYLEFVAYSQGWISVPSSMHLSA